MVGGEKGTCFLGRKNCMRVKVGEFGVPEDGGASVPSEQVVWKVIGGEMGGVCYG